MTTQTTLRLCPDCGGPSRRGWTGNIPLSGRCCLCETARVLLKPSKPRKQTAKGVIYAALRSGPKTYAQLATALKAAHYAESGMRDYIYLMLRAGQIVRVQRANRNRPAIFALSKGAT